MEFIIQRNFLYNLQRLFIHPTYFNNKNHIKIYIYIYYFYSKQNDLIDIYKNFKKQNLKFIINLSFAININNFNFESNREKEFILFWLSDIKVLEKEKRNRI